MDNIKKYTNAELATIAVARLNGRSIPLDLEDIAMELLRIAAPRFSLKKYPNHVDMHVVRVSLSDAQRKSPSLLSGGIKDGYLLSPDGVKWIDQLGDILPGGSDNDSFRKGSYLHTLDAEKQRLYKTRAYTLILDGKTAEIKITDLYEFLRINEYFPEKKIVNRIRIINNAMRDDKSLESVWKTLQELFKQELSRYE